MRTLSICTGALLSALFALAALPALAQTVNVPAGTTQTISTAIGDGSSPDALSVTGGGTLALTSGVNNYSGGTTVSGNSTLQVGEDTDIGAPTSPLTLGGNGSSGTLDVTPSTGVVTSSRPISLNGTGGTIIANTNTWTFTGVVSGPGSLTITGASGGVQLNGTNP